MTKNIIDAEHFDARVREAMGMAMDDLPMEYQEAVQAILAMLKTEPSVYVPRWIPVEDGLPEEEGQYLVSCDTDYGVEVARFYIDEDGERYFGCDWNNPEDIEAWMPLPTPYKGGEEE